MKSLKGTQTEKNLLKAFAGESQARNRYMMFASKARKEGMQWVADIFEETAGNEFEHAEVFFKFLEGGEVTIEATFPAGVIGTTAQNLKAAAHGEHEEWEDLYPEFSRIAKEEGFPLVAAAFRLIVAVEKRHEERYLALMELVESGKMFKSDENATWRCSKCGHQHTGKTPPQECPICAHDQGYFSQHPHAIED